MSAGDPHSRPAKATERSAEAQRREAEVRSEGAAGGPTGDLPAPPPTPPASRGDEATIRVQAKNPDSRPRPFYEARAFVKGAEVVRCVATARSAALGGAYSALVTYWLSQDAKGEK